MVSSPPRSKLSPPRNRLLHAEPPKSRIEKQLFHNDEAAVVDTSCNNKETAKPDAHVRVIARIRPMNHIEAKRGCKRCIYEEDRKENHMPPAVVEGGTSNSFLSRLKSSFTSPTTTTLNNSDTPEKFDEGIVLADATPLVSNMSSRLQSSSTLHTQHSDTNITPPNHKKSSSMPTRLIAESNNTTRTFEFDAVLPPTASQRDVYEAATGNNIRANLLHGYNTTILAYGQTGSGKTYTMGGLRDARALAGEALSPAPANQHSSNSNNEQDGVIARAIRELFLAKQEQESNGLQVTIRLSCLEIYQDELRDLMVESQQQLQMRDHGNDVTVQGLTCVQVKSVNQVQALMEQATLRRTTAATRLNERSSRSHAICTLSITTTTAAGRGAAATKKPLKARLTLVDLAGSERIKETGVVGVHAQESININKDLFVLGKVVSALAERGKNGKAHIPYRDSKLTRLLRQALGGNSITVLIACVSPADVNVDESINTLRYAERTRTIQNSVKQNVIDSERPSPAELASLRAENKRLKAQVLKLKQEQMLPRNDDDHSEQERSVDKELSGLQEKLKLAEEQARIAREKSRQVAQTADEWKERFEKTKNLALKRDSVVSPCLSYELSVAGQGDEESLIDEDDDASILTLDTTSRNLVADMDASQMILEIDALKNEKELIEEELVEISDLLLSKQSDLEKLEEEAEERRATLYAEIEKQEKQRDELAEEVAQMKRRLNLLASESVSTKDSGETEGMKLARELGKSLGEERARCDELEMKCESLQQRIQMSEENNNTLLLANIRLQEELRKLKQQTKHGKAIEANDELSVHLSHVSEGSSEEGKEENDGGVQMQIDTTASEERLRAKAREILEMAEAARDAASPGKASICSSMAYSVGTELLFKYGDDEKEDHASLESLSPHGQVMISGLETVREDNERCACETNIFAGQAEHVEFYLPQLGVACSCGKRQTFADDCDPSSLASILRPWQFEFLQSVGINDPVEFVHAFHQRGAVLAKQMRSWRRQKKLLSVKTKSCLIALHIWSRTCRAVIRSIRQQQAQGIEKPQRPDFLEINLSDNNTVSTLGLASAYQYK